MKASVNRSTLVLTELILNLFIFAVSAAVCVSLFLKAHDMSRESGRLTEAVYMAQTIAEEWRAAGAVPARQPSGESGFVSALHQRGNALDISIQTADGREIYALRGVTFLG